VGLVVFPYRYLLRGDPADNPWGVDTKSFRINPFERLEALARREGFIWVDLRTAYQEERDKMLAGKIPYRHLFGPLEYNHPDAAGHRIAAEAVYRALVQGGILRQSMR